MDRGFLERRPVQSGRGVRYLAVRTSEAGPARASAGLAGDEGTAFLVELGRGTRDAHPSVAPAICVRSSGRLPSGAARVAEAATAAGTGMGGLASNTGGIAGMSKRALMHPCSAGLECQRTKLTTAAYTRASAPPAAFALSAGSRFPARNESGPSSGLQALRQELFSELASVQSLGFLTAALASVRRQRALEAACLRLPVQSDLVGCEKLDSASQAISGLPGIDCHRLIGMRSRSVRGVPSGINKERASSTPSLERCGVTDGVASCGVSTKDLTDAGIAVGQKRQSSNTSSGVPAKRVRSQGVVQPLP